ncbi:hypothetical protein [Emcibacter sp.]|uniref:hypothetical protein n=1 Tax=Emcibacter sp. TaxID=1979954 RepID=UPI002AA8FD76|nr:hypothetical protein [Emcibacter sp.]
MKRKLVLGSISAALLLLTAQPQAQAGIFDKLKKKAGEIVKDEAQEAAKDAVGLGEEKQTSPSSSSSKSASAGSSAKSEVKVSGGDQPTTAVKMARAVLSIAPDILETRPDHQLKQFVLVFYPEENSKLSSEFYWRKNKVDFTKKMLKESEGAPTTFEVAPWMDNRSFPEGALNNYPNDLMLQVGRYDFDKGAWPVYVPAGDKWIIPWVSRYREPVGYQVPAVKEAKTYWIPMSAEKAEKLDQTFFGSYKLYAQYRFTVAGVAGVHPEEHPDYEQNKKYMKGKYKDQVLDKLVPFGQISIEGNKLDLYVKAVKGIPKSKDDFQFVTSLELKP